MSAEPSTLLICARVSPGREEAFQQWQVGWQTAVLAASPAVAAIVADPRIADVAGALTVELWPAAPPDQLETVVTARFPSMERLRQWRRGGTHLNLIEQVTKLVEGGLVFQLVGQAAVDYAVRHGVTLVIVTDIKPGKEAEYRAWADRIAKVQATFPGYIGSFVQPPQHNETGWTAVLRFDTAAHLDAWLKSDARAAMLKEGAELVQGFHAQRVDTAFPGPDSSPTGGRRPASFCSRSFRSSCWRSAILIRICTGSIRRSARSSAMC